MYNIIYMVTSHINLAVNYEKHGINDDLSHTSNVYEMEVLGKNIEIVLGKNKEKENLTYFITYVVLENNKVRPIGIFEIETKNMSGILDEDGDIDIDKLTGPLLFDNIELTNSLIPSDTEVPEPDTEVPEPDTDVPEPDTEVPEPDTEVPAPKHAVEFPDASRSNEKTEKELVTSGLWIKQFMQNKNYSIVDNEGGGDCLFAVIRDAFEFANKQYTVGDLRKILSNEVTQDVFENYRSLYESFNVAIKNTKEQLTMIAEENNKLKERLPKEENITKQMAIVERAKKLKATFMKLKRELAISKEMLSEQSFMANVTSFAQFKAKINTCKFWGDTWAISTLERVLNAKFILLSEESFNNDDIKNVLQCGQLNDVILEEKKIFTPDYYIIMDYNGYHYKLITYKEHGIFTFKQLPFVIRDLITDKCLEKMAGPYAIIPEFASEKVEISIVDGDITSVSTIDADPETVFMFYERSNKKPHPGKGSGEKIRDDQRNVYKKLAAFTDWRRKLSNEWKLPIDVDGHQWQSVEHYYQGSKYKNSRPDIYYQFTLDSRSELGKSVERAKKFNDFEPDMDFFGKRGKEVLQKGLEAKFTQDKEMRNILQATHDATLTEYQAKKPAKSAFYLMTLRKNLSK